MKRTTNLMGMMLAAGLLAAVAMGQAVPAAGGGRAAPAPAPGPLRLAVVDVQRLMAGLDETKVDSDSLEAMKKDYTVKQQKLQKAIDSDQTSLQGNDLKVGSVAYHNLEQELLQLTADYDSFMKVSQEMLFMEVRSRKAMLYEKAMKAIAAYSQANGFGLVFATDDQDMLQSRTPQDLQMMIELKKLLYYNPVLDITKPIIEKMNTEYKLGGK